VIDGVGVLLPVLVGVDVCVGVSVRVGLPVGIGVGLSVAVAVDVGVFVDVAVAAAVGDGVTVTVGVSVQVLVAVGVSVSVLVGVGVWLGVPVGVGVAAAVSVGVGVAVGVSAGVRVAVSVGVGAFVGVSVGVTIGVSVAAPSALCPSSPMARSGCALITMRSTVMPAQSCGRLDMTTVTIPCCHRRKDETELELKPNASKLRTVRSDGHSSRRPLGTLRHGAKRARLLRSGLLRVSGNLLRCNAFPAHAEEAPSVQAPSRSMRSWSNAAYLTGIELKPPLRRRPPVVFAERV
jgi:hypothetical protein